MQSSDSQSLGGRKARTCLQSRSICGVYGFLRPLLQRTRHELICSVNLYCERRGGRYFKWSGVQVRQFKSVRAAFQPADQWSLRGRQPMLTQVLRRAAAARFPACGGAASFGGFTTAAACASAFLCIAARRNAPAIVLPRRQRRQQRPLLAWQLCVLLLRDRRRLWRLIIDGHWRQGFLIANETTKLSSSRGPPLLQ